MLLYLLGLASASSSQQPAKMYALAGKMRAGASRACYTSPKLFVAINGVQVANARLTDANNVKLDSVHITEVLHETPNTAAFTTQGIEPTEGQDVVITLGSINNLNRQFAGTILNRAHRYVDKPAIWFADINAIDYTWQLTRRRVSGAYTNTAPATIAAAIVAAVPGFTLSVQAGLPTLDSFSYTDVDALTALTRLAKRVGGYCDVDYHKVVKLFITDNSVTNPITLTPGHLTLTEFSYTKDLSQVRTRIFVEGGGVNAVFACAVGATTLPVEDVGWYNVAGGTVVSGPQRITYTGTRTNLQHSGAWVSRTSAVGPTGGFIGVAYSPTLRLFVAVGGTVSGASSPDGITWTARTLPLANTWRAVTWAPALALFVAVGQSGAIATSPDGITWTQRTAPAANAYSGVTWSPTLGLLVAVAFTGANRVMTSPDGITWTAQTAAAANTWISVTWAQALGLFVAVSTDGADRVMTSPNGTAWTSRTAAALNQWQDVAWSANQGLLVAVSSDGSGVMTSTNGTAWVSRTAAAAIQWYGAVWSPEEARWVAVGYDTVSGVNMAMTSLDGTTWTIEASSARSVWARVVWSPELYRYVAVGDSVNGVYAMSSDATNLGTLLTGIPASGAGSIQYAIKQGDAVNLLVQCDDVANQTTLAALLSTGTVASVSAANPAVVTTAAAHGFTTGQTITITGTTTTPSINGQQVVTVINPTSFSVPVNVTVGQGGAAGTVGVDDGIVEDSLRDGTIGETEARARGTAQLALLSTALVSILGKTRDVNSHAGRTMTVALGSPTNLSGTFQIQQVTIDSFQYPTLYPTYTVEASSARFSLEDLLRLARAA